MNKLHDMAKFKRQHLWTGIFTG